MSRKRSRLYLWVALVFLFFKSTPRRHWSGDGVGGASGRRDEVTKDSNATCILLLLLLSSSYNYITVKQVPNKEG